MRPPILYDKGSYYLLDLSPLLKWICARGFSMLKKAWSILAPILAPVLVGTILATLFIASQWALYILIK